MTVPGPMAAASGPELPQWFEQNRVQAHFENRIEEDLDGMYRDLHAAVATMGARVLTRIFKTTGEGAWWPTASGPAHESLAGRDLGREIAEDAHARGLKVVAYYRIMSDDFIEREHPDWLCRDAAGKLVVEPRTRRRPQPTHVICLNSPAREHTLTRLLELAGRGVDGIYFDSWHMPEICACAHCQIAYEKLAGEPMDVSGGRGSESYRRAAHFAGKTIVRTFAEWKSAVKRRYPGVLFAISSSLYPCFDTQMQITADLLAISDASKTEFSKPFGGHPRPPAADAKGAHRRQGFMDATFAMPAYDIQNALGWSLTRDSCDGRPPLMWIPFTRTETKALYSAAASVAYGNIASVHPEGLRAPRSTEIHPGALRLYEPCYALGTKVSPFLAGARPMKFALIHVSARARDARIADPRALWLEFFAPILGAFEALKEKHIPVATINDAQLERGVPDETRVLILSSGSEFSGAQAEEVRKFESAGGTVIRLDPGAGWHLAARKNELKRGVVDAIGRASQRAPIRARGPAAMHAVFFQEPGSGRTVVCMVNAFGWFKSSREDTAGSDAGDEPPPCSGVTIELDMARAPIKRAFEAVSGTRLTPEEKAGRLVLAVPDFPVFACAVIE